MNSATADLKPSDEVITAVHGWCEAFPHRQGIASILRDMSVMVQFVEHQSAADPTFYSNWDVASDYLMPLMHRCLSFVPQKDTDRYEPGFSLQECIRLACHLFFSNIRRMFGIRMLHALSELRRQRLRSLRQVIEASVGEWDNHGAVIRWVLFAAGLEANEDADLRWAAEAMADRCCLVPHSGMGQLSSVKRFIWFNGIDETRLSRFMSHVDAAQSVAMSGV
jgi:hypothetical protein